MKVKLKDIAEATGFSVNTVSHALRDRPDIPESTREKIKLAAKEMGYIKNAHASSFRSGKTSTISVILPDITNPHFTIVFREIEEYFRGVGMTPMFINTNENAEEELNAVRHAIEQNSAGVIICPTQDNKDSLRLLEKSSIPYVLIGRRFPEEKGSDYVVCDDTEGAACATESLILSGHKKIAFVGAGELISSGRERLLGYKSALAEAKIPYDDTYVYHVDLKSAPSTEALESFLSQISDATAIVAFSDSLAFRIIRSLAKLGRRVPEDVSVIGFDNVCSDYIFPTMLSSVSVSKKTMAKEASSLLFKKISSPTAPPEHIVLPTKLFPRETTAKRK